MRYRAISELVEIGAAYEVAIENFPDDLKQQMNYSNAVLLNTCK